MHSALNEIFESPPRDFSLARRNWNRRRSAERTVALHIVLGERFFEPADIELLQQSGALQRRRNLKRQSGVDHHISGISGRPASGLYMRHVLGGVLAEWPPAEFHCRETQVNSLTRQLPGFLWTRAEQITRIRADRGAAPISQQLVD